MEMTTIRELYLYNDWARDRILAASKELPPEKLDRPFEMGEGSLRKTLDHIFGAEWLWLQRWKGWSPKRHEMPHDFASLADLWDVWRKTADERDRHFETLTPGDLQRNITYTNTRGDTYTFKLGHMILHVFNHGTHHRAQAINMLRHLGVPPMETDFLEMFE